MDESFHRPSPGQSQNLCDFYIMMLRSIVYWQNAQIMDMQRRLDGKPITQKFLDRVLPDE